MKKREPHSTIVSTKLERNTFNIIEDLSVERSQSRSAVVREIVERYAYGFKLRSVKDLAMERDYG